MKIYHMMANVAAWQGDWRARINSRLQQSGFGGLLEFLRRHPGTWYVELAKELGSDVVGKQLVVTAFKEARARDQLRWAAMDCLVRHIREVFQNGWGNVYIVIPPPNPVFPEESARRLAARPAEENIRFQKAHAFSGFVIDLDDDCSPPLLRDLGNAIGDVFDELRPPVGWLPASPDDPIIQEAFSRVWPPGREKRFTPEFAAERLKEKGYASLLDCLEDRPAQPYEELVKEIGPDPIAVEFLRWFHLREAERAGAVRRAAMDCLAREIVQAGGWPAVPVYGPKGPESTKELEWNATAIHDTWMHALLSYADTDIVEATWEALEKLSPPRGWLPSGPDDPFIVAAFEKRWPPRRS